MPKSKRAAARAAHIHAVTSTVTAATDVPREALGAPLPGVFMDEPVAIAVLTPLGDGAAAAHIVCPYRCPAVTHAHGVVLPGTSPRLEHRQAHCPTLGRVGYWLYVDRSVVATIEAVSK